MHKNRRRFWIIVLVVGVLVFIGIGVYAATTLLEYKKDREEYNELRSAKRTEVGVSPTAYDGPLFVTAPSDDGSVSPEGTLAPLPSRQSLIDFASLQSINPDCIGWITLYGTNIDYPIVQGTDDTHYLTHSFRNEASKSGCVFLGQLYDKGFSGANNVLYGHHMKDGSMFHDLVLYKEEEFFRQNLTGTLYTPEATYALTVFSAYVVDSDGQFQQTGFNDPDLANTFYASMAARSTVAAPFVPEWPDQILTLVTCTYEYTDARYVVHALMTPI